jgi:hypothetical protein
MSTSSEWMIYGANGYTGVRIAREAVRRGQKPLIAGRNRQAIEQLAAELRCPARVFGLDSVNEIDRSRDRWFEGRRTLRRSFLGHRRADDGSLHSGPRKLPGHHRRD